MRVLFNQAVLADPSAYRWIERIIPLFEDERHLWMVRDADVVLASPWYRQSGGGWQRRIKALLKGSRAGVYGRRGIQVEVVPQTAPQARADYLRISPSESYEYLSQPLGILVEDATSDGAFLSALLWVFGEKETPRWLRGDRAQWQQQWDNTTGRRGWLEIVHGGGSRTADILIGRHQPPGSIPPRLVVLLDSDHTVPSQEGPPRRSTWEKCEKAAAQIRAWGTVPPGLSPNLLVLKRRESENYLPVPALDRFASVRARGRTFVATYRSLRPESRRHFLDLKKGLMSSLDDETKTADPRTQDPSTWRWIENGQRNLYMETNAEENPLTHSQLLSILQGLGGNLHTAWTKGSPTITRNTMKKEADIELRFLLREILEAW